MAAGLTLAPELLPAAAEIGGVAAVQRGAEGFRVHVRQHEHRAGTGALGDGGHEALLVKLDAGEVGIYRLGRGKGYYDRLLSKMPHIYKIGLCFPFQFVDNIPTEITDIRMDEVVC